VGQRLAAPAAGITRGWRRSLQSRVVTTTVVLSLTVVAMLGVVLTRQITSGLLGAKEQAAQNEVSSGLVTAQSQLDLIDENSAPTTVSEQLTSLVQTLATRGGSTPGGDAGRYEVLLLRSELAPGSAVTPGITSFEISERSVPQRLRDVVATKQRLAYTYVEMRYSSGQTAPGLAVGAPLNVPDAGSYELYYLFPLTEEAETLALVQRTLAFAGLVLVMLIGLISWVVTRQVVTPVRMAARVAERISAGRLEHRMRVRGEDDLALLASSFNQMATSLQRQIRQLEDLSRVQRRFVSDVSHELRTPLTTVRMAADVLHEARPAFDPAVARSAELLQTQLDRFEALLGDLLEISRFDAGAALLDAEPVDLRDVARLVIEAAEPLAQHRGTRIRLEAPAAPCVAEVDPRRIQRVLRNLVVNAVEHGEGRDVVVRVAADERAVAVAVRDHGVGLRPGEAALVFNRFWRADPARSRSTGGTGLGLSIALEDARLHNGWLQAWGAPGDGSQFRLTVPRRAGADIDASPIPLEPEDARRPRRSAVLVGGPNQRPDTRGGAGVR